MDMRWLGDAQLQPLLARASANLAQDFASSSPKAALLHKVLCRKVYPKHKGTYRKCEAQT